MSVRLRAHHLLCMLTYVGEGYSPAFVANYDHVAERLSNGEEVLVVTGPDDICAPLLQSSLPHCVRDCVDARDRRAALDVGAILGRMIEEGVYLQLDAGALARMRTSFGSGAARKACEGCEWFRFCTGIAAEGFENIRVRKR